MLKTVINCEEDSSSKDNNIQVEFTNNYLDNDNFVDVNIKVLDENIDDYVHYINFNASVEDLEMAIMPFIELMKRFKKTYEE